MAWPWIPFWWMSISSEALENASDMNWVLQDWWWTRHCDRKLREAGSDLSQASGKKRNVVQYSPSFTAGTINHSPDGTHTKNPRKRIPCPQFSPEGECMLAPAPRHLGLVPCQLWKQSQMVRHFGCVRSEPQASSALVSHGKGEEQWAANGLAVGQQTQIASNRIQRLRRWWNLLVSMRCRTHSSHWWRSYAKNGQELLPGVCSQRMSTSTWRRLVARFKARNA